jgi:hypothetical protein
MVSALASSAVDGFEPRTGHTKDYKTEIKGYIYIIVQIYKLILQLLGFLCVIINVLK